MVNNNGKIGQTGASEAISKLQGLDPTQHQKAAGAIGALAEINANATKSDNLPSVEALFTAQQIIGSLA